MATDDNEHDEGFDVQQLRGQSPGELGRMVSAGSLRAFTAPWCKTNAMKRCHVDVKGQFMSLCVKKNGVAFGAT